MAALHPQAPRRPVHFWPFDGWDIPAGRSAIAEVFPSWRRGLPHHDQHDPFCGSLATFLKSDRSPRSRSLGASNAAVRAEKRR
jgi:hypothetical protein